MKITTKKNLIIMYTNKDKFIKQDRNLSKHKLTSRRSLDNDLQQGQISFFTDKQLEEFNKSHHIESSINSSLDYFLFDCANLILSKEGDKLKDILKKQNDIHYYTLPPISIEKFKNYLFGDFRDYKTEKKVLSIIDQRNRKGYPSKTINFSNKKGIYDYRRIAPIMAIPRLTNNENKKKKELSKKIKNLKQFKDDHSFMDKYIEIKIAKPLIKNIVENKNNYVYIPLYFTAKIQWIINLTSKYIKEQQQKYLIDIPKEEESIFNPFYNLKGIPTLLKTFDYVSIHNNWKPKQIRQAIKDQEELKTTLNLNDFIKRILPSHLKIRDGKEILKNKDETKKYLMTIFGILGDINEFGLNERLPFSIIIDINFKENKIYLKLNSLKKDIPKDKKEIEQKLKKDIQDIYIEEYINFRQQILNDYINNSFS